MLRGGMRIKQIPEDFIVKELSKPKIEPGSYSYFKLKKTQWTTIAAIKQIAIRARMNTKFIGIAGNKDKEGITKQTISIFRTNKERIKDLKINELLRRIREPEIKEVILAFSPDLNGETTMMFLKNKIKEANPNLKITRLARGLPIGADLEYADEVTLSSALKNRREL